MEEDLISQSEDSSQVNVLSVLVTFRTHTSEDTGQAEPNEGNEAAKDSNNNMINNNNTSNNDNNDNTADRSCTKRDDKSFTKFRRRSFPSNPPATPETSAEERNTSKDFRGEKEDPAPTESTAVLKVDVVVCAHIGLPHFSWSRLS